MLSTFIKKILPPEEEYFFMCFEETANICNKACEQLLDILRNGCTDEKVLAVKACKKESAKISKESLEKLNASFVTPIDREDIQHLTSSLHKINRRIVRACVNIKLFKITQFEERMIKQAETLLEAIRELQTCVGFMKKHSPAQRFVESRERVSEIESKGDEIFSSVIEDLFSGRYDAIDVIKLRDIHSNIETAINTCVLVADDVMQIMLKHG